MEGLRINGKHTYRDFGLKMLSYKITPPEPTIKKIKVPGLDGTLDVSEAVGGLKFEEREFLAVFDFAEEDAGLRLQKLSKIQNAINGVVSTIILDSDPNFYYEGRLLVDYDKINPYYTEVSLEGEVFPYKMKNNLTTISKTISKQGTITCPNLRKPVIPKITCNANMNLTFNNISVSLQSGTSLVPDFIFKEGDNIVTCSGNGKVSFEYREGSL